MLKKLTSLMLVTASLTLCSVATTACAYRPDVAQGNFTEQKDVDKLRVGMTPEQVKYVLSTPMLTNPLHKNKWYYINYVRRGWEEPESKRLIVSFGPDGRLYDISGDFAKSPSFNTPL